MAISPTTTTMSSMKGASGDQIMVYPTRKNALVLRHPISGPLMSAGSLWVQDGFTARMMMEGEITENKAIAYADPTPVDLSVPPPHATAIPDNPPTVALNKRDESNKPDAPVDPVAQSIMRGEKPPPAQK